MFLPDINFWLALTFEVHFHHVAARQWYEAHLVESFFFCHFTQQGFLRLVSNPKAFGEQAVWLKDGWVLYESILSDQNCPVKQALFQLSYDPANNVFSFVGSGRACLWTRP
ncbi:MAG: hypothetical protein HY646_19745 [Acidobacteria bacterium]|nr:hypothetical protein [Acidobacteriota bacterium]